MFTIPYKLHAEKQVIADWLPVLLGLLVLYVPTFYGLLNGIWAEEEQAHGPIILFLSLWLIYRKWPEMMKRAWQRSWYRQGG